MPISPAGTNGDDNESVPPLLDPKGGGLRKTWDTPRVILARIARDSAGGTTTGFSTDVKLTATTLVAS